MKTLICILVTTLSLSAFADKVDSQETDACVQAGRNMAQLISENYLKLEKVLEDLENGNFKNNDQRGHLERQRDKLEMKIRSEKSILAAIDSHCNQEAQ